jgi:hypothetical protein
MRINKPNHIHLFCLACIFAMLLSACGSSSAYDASKAEQLTEEQRREMDVLLANEWATNNTNSKRCDIVYDEPFSSGKCRLAFYKELASKGYEMADIASRLYNPGTSTRINDKKAFKRLLQLADAGDKSALCFTGYVLIDLTVEKPYTLASVKKYIKQGVELGLPVCALVEAYAYHHYQSSDYPLDRKMGHLRALEAASGGLYLGQILLLHEYGHEFHYPTFAYDEARDLYGIRKALCWGRLAEHHSVAAGFRSYTRGLLRSARDRKDQSKLIYPKLRQLAIDWDLVSTPYEENPTTVKDCLSIEEEN